MRKEVIFLFLFIILIFNVSASCSKNQIDINSASATELDKLYGIGPAKAQSIIDSRPFDSVSDLIDVNGIGEVTLDKIKSEGLACVADEEDDKKTSSDEEEKEEKDKKEISSKNEEVEEENFVDENNNVTLVNYNVEREVINLAPKDIKTEINSEKEHNMNYPVIGLVLFCLVLGGLFVFKEKSRYRKNEFKE